MSDYNQYLEIMKTNPIFWGINEQQLISMIHCFHPKVMKYPKNTLIAREHEPYKGIGIVLSGEVMVGKENEEGERTLIAKFGEGQLFGEMIAFSKIDYWPVTVVATTDSEIIFLNPDRIVRTCARLCEGHRQLIMNLLSILSNKAMVLNRKVEYLSKKSMRGKLSKYLLEEMDKNEAKSFIMALNRTELAEFLYVSRPSMSRELGRMKNEGLIDFHGNHFRILDVDQLFDESMKS